MNFKKSWDIYFRKVLDRDFLKFMEHDFQKFKELCFSVFIFFVIKKTELKKHLFFLFKVYYSPMVDYTERRNFNRSYNNIFFRGGFFKISLKYATMNFVFC